MARRHGRNGRMYVQLGASGNATPVAFQTQWSIDSKTDRTDVTAQGDSNKTYVVGLPDAQGAYQGFNDSDGNDLYLASQDGIARKFYLYPDIVNDAGDYYFGTGFFDFSMSSGVSAANGSSGSWAAASLVQRVNA